MSKALLMTEFFAALLTGVIRFYAWTLGIGLPTLLLISLTESTADLIRERRSGRVSRVVARNT